MHAPAKFLAPLCAVAIALALAGLTVGTGAVHSAWKPNETVRPEVPTGVLPAVPYGEMNGKERGPNRAYVSDLRTLVSRAPAITDQVVQNEAERQATLARRAARRAYVGAPPTIPHPVDANDVASCYQCHGDGKNIDGLIAPKISHQRYTNCTQCHAQAATPAPGNMPEFAVANAFVGLSSPGRGVRAYPGAPPQIPHQTDMRENCMSCHGVLGMQGLRSTHPWRANCQQCHVPSANLDQRKFTDATPPPWAAEAR